MLQKLNQTLQKVLSLDHFSFKNETKGSPAIIIQDH